MGGKAKRYIMSMFPTELAAESNTLSIGDWINKFLSLLVPFKNQQKILISYGFQINRILIFKINININISRKIHRKPPRKPYCFVSQQEPLVGLRHTPFVKVHPCCENFSFIKEAFCKPCVKASLLPRLFVDQNPFVNLISFCQVAPLPREFPHGDSFLSKGYARILWSRCAW